MCPTGHNSNRIMLRQPCAPAAPPQVLLNHGFEEGSADYKVVIGLGCIVALYHRPSTSYLIC